mmetsp:Transcript_52496/g.111877  ORF Transcript_52496/g.111877 Transcript_52496/m.111877 type:complete len:253 (+) Transcript_52496:711-1469(+)
MVAVGRVAAAAADEIQQRLPGYFSHCVARLRCGFCGSGGRRRRQGRSRWRYTCAGGGGRSCGCVRGAICHGGLQGDRALKHLHEVLSVLGLLLFLLGGICSLSGVGKSQHMSNFTQWLLSEQVVFRKRPNFLCHHEFVGGVKSLRFDNFIQGFPKFLAISVGRVILNPTLEPMWLRTKDDSRQATWKFQRRKNLEGLWPPCAEERGGLGRHLAPATVAQALYQHGAHRKNAITVEPCNLHENLQPQLWENFL